jgi:CDP-4-dehydro-6-deoxyglucose reductase
MAWWRTKHRNFDYKITLTREAEGFLRARRCRVAAAVQGPVQAHHLRRRQPRVRRYCVAAAKAQGAQDELIHTEGFFAQQQPVVADADHLLPL